ncbi:MAG: glycerophosphodiester phosphodiesterase family protein [Candidatus Competibacteraceae bacterium]
MSLILGHRGLSTTHLENSLDAFRAALAVGMDGFELDVQPTRDGVCMVLHDETLDRTASAGGILRQMNASALPGLKNGESVPRLLDVLQLPALRVNVELKGRPGWKPALAAVKSANALDRVLFSSFEHREILQLWTACPEARCGFLWETREALALTAATLADLPPALWLHIPLEALQHRPELWAPFALRLAAWGMRSAAEAQVLPFEPAIVIADAL